MSPYALGGFLGAMVPVLILQALVRIFWKHPVGPIVVAWVAGMVLSYFGNDGQLALPTVLGMTLSAVLLGLYYSKRQQKLAEKAPQAPADSGQRP